MPRLAPIHWKKFEKVVLFIGCYFVREKGDHKIYWRDDIKRPIIIPKYTDLPIFIIRNNLRILGLSTKEYLDILKRI